MAESLSPTRAEIQNFFSSIGYLVSAADRVEADFARRLGTRFNVLDFIDPDENRLSDIFADLLDPRGTHGQGDCFLQAFVDILSIDRNVLFPTGGSNTVHVLREASTDNGRIDIVLTIDGGGAIGIENKPHAMDQPEQMKRYAAHLKKYYRESFFLVYLSGNGTSPVEHEYQLWRDALEAERRRLASYNGSEDTDFVKGTLKDWIDRCYQLAESEKVRWFLRDLSSYIDREFSASLIGEHK